jgi:hypothetical protein
MLSRIPNFGVKLTDLKNGLITREWFRFLEGLWSLTGANNNALSIQDLAIGGVAPIAQEVVGAGRIIANKKSVLDFPNTAANAVSDLTVSVPGAVVNDEVTLTVSSTSVPAGGTYFAWISAADTATVRYANNTAVAYDPTVSSFRVVVRRY